MLKDLQDKELGHLEYNLMNHDPACLIEEWTNVKLSELEAERVDRLNQHDFFQRDFIRQ